MQTIIKLVFLNQKRAFQLKEDSETNKKSTQLEQEPTVVALTVFKIIKKAKPRQIPAESTDKN